MTREIVLAKVLLHYSIPGRNRMQCDRDFGRKKMKLKMDQVIKPFDWILLVRTATHRFEVIFVSHPLPEDK